MVALPPQFRTSTGSIAGKYLSTYIDEIKILLLGEKTRLEAHRGCQNAQD